MDNRILLLDQIRFDTLIRHDEINYHFQRDIGFACKKTRKIRNRLPQSEVQRICSACRERVILLLLLTSGEPVNPRSPVTRDLHFYFRERRKGAERYPVTRGIKIHALPTR